jgi:hypothetical protein
MTVSEVAPVIRKNADICSAGDFALRAPEPRRPQSVLCTGFLEAIVMGRYMLLWLIGVPIPILLLIWAFGGLH